MNNIPDNKNLESQALLNQIVIEYMREQRRKRIWRWILRGFIVIVIATSYIKLTNFTNNKRASDNPHVGLINITGTIFDTETANADYFSKGLEAAYKKSGLKALIIRINSSGGSPVQADYMYNTIRYYRNHYPTIKIYAVCVDICASAAYYIAAAADDIYANESSMIGSIGVLYNGFGFVDAMQKLGVTRRLQTAGSNKGFLDPFSPMNTTQQQWLQGMLNDVHEQFIAKVKNGRGDRLKIDADTFSGLFWTGIRAKERGLIDGFASSGQLARDVLKLNSVIDYTYKQSMFERVSKNMGSAIADRLLLTLGMIPGIKA